MKNIFVLAHLFITVHLDQKTPKISITFMVLSSQSGTCPRFVPCLRTR